MNNRYIKTTLPFLRQNKVFTAINVMGLSIALAASFVIMLYVVNELSYNRCHKNRKQVYRILNHFVESKITCPTSPYVLASALKGDFPQVKKAAGTMSAKLQIKHNNELLEVNEGVATDSEIFDIFTIPLLNGTPKENLLDEKNSIVLSRALSEKLFGFDNPVGKEITGIIFNTEQAFIVKGVFENLPPNSTFRAECLVNSRWRIDDLKAKLKNWGDWMFDFWETWILLPGDCNTAELEKQFVPFEKKYLGDKPVKHFSLQNLTDVYLGSANVDNSNIRGDMNKVKLFASIALLIILLAVFNYIILSVAISSGRAKEIGIRKTNGAGIRTIRFQLLEESVILSAMVLPLAIFLAWLALPYAGKLFQANLIIIPSNLIIYILVCLVITIAIGVVSGLYTTYYLSGITVVNVLKNNLGNNKGKHVFRSALIVFQLVIFCSFLSATMIIKGQYQYLLKKDAGFLQKNIIFLNVGDANSSNALVDIIKSNPNVTQVAATVFRIPSENWGVLMAPHFQQKDKKIKVESLTVGFNFLKTMGIPIIKGRDFSDEFGSDLTQSAILNETAVRQLGYLDPIGEKIIDRTIVGVAKDFNFHSNNSNIPPAMILLSDKYLRQVAVQYRPGSLNEILPFLESELKKVAPNRPFIHSNYTKIEDVVRNLYSTEKDLSSIISICSLFSFLIAAMGLFGLTLFLSKTRTKEIGIRKVYGSSEKQIVLSFIKNYFLLVSIAMTLSVPVTIYFMSKWLSNYANKTEISWWIFAVSFVLSLVVVLTTVLYHSMKASRINPVDALRYE